MLSINLRPDGKFELRDEKTNDLIALGTLLCSNDEGCTIGIDAARTVRVNEFRSDGKMKKKYGRF
jgi:hypothetical protein